MSGPAVRAEPGAANERTALAWQRTALSLVAGSAVLTRLTFPVLGPVSLVSLVVGLPLGAWVLVESRGRYRHSTGVSPRSHTRSGRAAVALTVGTLALAVTELLALLTR